MNPLDPVRSHPLSGLLAFWAEAGVEVAFEDRARSTDWPKAHADWRPSPPSPPCLRRPAPPPNGASPLTMRRP